MTDDVYLVDINRIVLPPVLTTDIQKYCKNTVLEQETPKRISPQKSQ